MIKEVAYEESRLISTGQYENMRVTVGCGATVEDGQTAEQALMGCQMFVRRHLRQRVINGVLGKETASQSAAENRIAKRYNLGDEVF